MMLPNQTQGLAALYYDALVTKDFKTFAGFCKIFSDFTQADIFLRYDNWTYAQRQFEGCRTGFDIVLKPRRIGFTTLELARDLFYSITNPGSTTVIVTQAEDMSEKAIDDIKSMIEYLRNLGNKIGFELVPKIKKSNKKNIWFDNKSKIRALIAKSDASSANRTGRGIGISRLHCTEVAFWRFPDLTMKSLLIAAKTATDIVIESTADGASGFFYNFYNKVKNKTDQYLSSRWAAHFYPWYLHASYKVGFDSERERAAFSLEPGNEYEKTLIEEVRVSPEQLNWWRQAVAQSPNGIEEVLQEFPIDEASCFRIKSQTFLDQGDFEFLERGHKPPMFKKDVREYFPMTKQLASLENACKTAKIYVAVWDEYFETVYNKKNCRYIIGVDTAYGQTQDSSTFTVVDVGTGNICATFASNKISPSDFGRLLAEVGKTYNNATLAIERQASGQAVIDAVRACRYPGRLYKHKDKDYAGFVTTATNRVNMFNLFQRVVKDKDLPILDVEIVNECRSLIFKGGRIEHASNSHDDRLMSFMIAQLVRHEMVGNIYAADSNASMSSLVGAGAGAGAHASKQLLDTASNSMTGEEYMQHVENVGTSPANKFFNVVGSKRHGFALR